MAECLLITRNSLNSLHQNKIKFHLKPEMAFILGVVSYFSSIVLILLHIQQLFILKEGLPEVLGLGK